MHRAHALALFALLFILLYGPGSGIAQTTRTPTETDARGVLDKFVTDQMAADGVLGVGVVVVKDGQVWYERGYGFEDGQKTRRVDPERTEFFAASVSKLFVATAAMQLSEQGRLDLDHDINQYLDFHLGAFYDSRPITVADLLTHTAGVDDHMVGAESPIQQPVDLGAYFREHIPRLIGPPGFEIDYSNHGVALAARVVERVSGMTFYDYSEQNILRAIADAPQQLPATGARTVEEPLGLGAVREALHNSLSGRDLSDHSVRHGQVHAGSLEGST